MFFLPLLMSAAIQTVCIEQEEVAAWTPIAWLNVRAFLSAVLLNLLIFPSYPQLPAIILLFWLLEHFSFLPQTIIVLLFLNLDLIVAFLIVTKNDTKVY